MIERQQLETFLNNSDMDYKYFEYPESIHTVDETVRIASVTADEVTKSMIFADPNNRIVRAVVLAKDRVSSKRLRKVLGVESVTLMPPDEVTRRTKYPPGGMPCIGYKAKTVVDPSVMERKMIYTGGGTIYSLLLVSVADFERITSPIVARIRK